MRGNRGHIDSNYKQSHSAAAARKKGASQELSNIILQGQYAKHSLFCSHVAFLYRVHLAPAATRSHAALAPCYATTPFDDPL